MGEHYLPLDGIRVVELATFAAAPVCAMSLADWGAEVIKVEPLAGDPMRKFGHVMKCPVRDDDNIQFELDNRNKRGISVDLKSPEGTQILHKLLQRSDVLITNFRPKALKALGLDYESVSAAHPRLIYAYLNGYGDEGPDRNKPGFDMAAYFARSGILVEFGEPGSDPLPPVAGFGDHTTGTFLVGGICAALYGREKTGRGSKVQTSLYGSAIWNLSLDIASSNNNGFFPISATRSKPMSALLNTYRTGDEHWITVIVLEYDRYWKAFCDIVLKMPELAQDPRFSTQAAHFKHGQEQAAIIDEVFRNMSLSECIERLEQADIVYEINNRWHEIKNDTQALENGFLMEIKMPSGRKEWVAGNPVKFNGRKTLIRSHSPRLGQHTDEVLLELGYSQDDVAGLAGRKIIRK